MSWPDYTYDIFEDFEDSTLASGLTEADADGIVSFPDSTQYWLGSNSAKWNNNGSAHTARFTLAPSAKNNFSAGFAWRTTATTSNYTFGSLIFEAGWATYSGSGIIRIYDGRDTGNNTRQFVIRFYGASTVDYKLTVSDNTWYWITVQYNRNSTSYCNIYTSDKTRVAQLSSDIINYACDFLRFGGSSAVYNSANYLDDIVIDWTNYAFPLLGWESVAASGGPLVGDSALVGGGFLCGQGVLIG